jgi:hypothetical protein
VSEHRHCCEAIEVLDVKTAGDLIHDGKVTVERAALLGTDGTIYSLPQPARHHDVMRHMADVHGFENVHHLEQGFVLSVGRFCRRRPAKLIAERAGQLLERASGNERLFSEDVW